MMSENNNNDNPNEYDDTALGELLSSRGFKSNLIKLRGYTSHGYRDKSRDVLSAVDLWDLELWIIPKDKRFRNYIIYDYKDSVVPVLGANNQVMMIPKDHHYEDTELLYLPRRLLGKIFYNVPESEIDMYRDESKEEGVIWLDSIPGLTPVRELMEKVHPLLLDQATHIFIEDHEKNAKSEINNNPRSEDIEIFYRPFRNAAGHCWKWDCPICQPVQKFLEAYKKADKKAPDFLILGLRFDDPESVRLDNLKWLEGLAELASLSFQVMQTNFAIWDMWDQLDAAERTR